MNKIILIGNIGKEIESKTFDNGNTKYSFSMATNENFKNKDGEWQTVTEWHNVYTFRSDCSYLNKGDTVVVEGKIKTRSYESKGERKYITEIEALSVKRLSKKTEGESSREEDTLPF